MDLSKAIKQKSRQIGFDLVGITTAEPIDAEQIKLLFDWLSSGYAGQMQFMHRNFEKRTEPAKLLKGARSVICVGLSYRPPSSVDTAPPINRTNCGKIANFALYQDYHSFIKAGLGELTDFINSVVGREKWKFKICVDSVPIAERALAQRGGLGFIGKNHMLINARLGSQILLGEIVTDLKLAPDFPMQNQCRDCKKCIAACPTQALDEYGCFDAAKCISYLTIEHKGPIDESVACKIGDRLFGCDECVLACPYEEKAPPYANKRLKIFPKRRWMGLRQIQMWDKVQFERHFAASTVKRLGLERLKRNANICLQNAISGQGARKMSPEAGVSQPE